MMQDSKQHCFEQVYRQSYRKVFNFAKRLCNNAELAEDVTQETFLRAFAAFDTCRDATRIEKWLMRIVHNVFVDTKRREKRRICTLSESVFAEEGFLDHIADTHQTIEEILTGNNCDPVVAQVIASMKPQSRELLRLVYVEQMPHEEIGKLLGVGTGATRSRVHRLCVHLKRSIQIQRFGTA
jgi:RNA polymerase sigma-70 factor (ECF subfamily)